VIIFGLILSAGFFGLWFLSTYGTEIKIQNTFKISNSKNLTNDLSDKFSDIGGKTPKETINLLIKALEKNDLTVAAEYFIPEAREIESEDFKKLYDTNLLGDLIKDLKNIESGRNLNENRYQFDVYDETGQPATEVELIKNENGLWKILSL
jgi:hypothetical protein